MTRLMTATLERRAPQTLRLAALAMGTRFEVALPFPANGLPERDLRAAGEAALDEIALWHERLNRFSPDSLVSHINRSAAAAPVRLDDETFALFADAMVVWRASGGAFDVTMAPVKARLGFKDGAVPSRGEGGMASAIVLDRVRGTIAFAQDEVSVDLGGIAKGHALDRAAALLRAAGVRSALLHGGTSSVAALGVPSGESGWRVRVGLGARQAVVLADSSLSVSDPSSQRRLTGADHIVAPAGFHDRHACAVTVSGPSARLADAWSTALAVRGDLPPQFPAGYTATFSRAVS